MNIDDVRAFCLGLPGTDEGFPFGESTLVFRVMGKMFALAALEASPLRVNLKTRPELAIEQRERYSSVLPGYHMNKQHWNTVIFDGEVRDEDLRDWIRLSYDLVVSSLSKKLQSELASL